MTGIYMILYDRIHLDKSTQTKVKNNKIQPIQILNPS